MATDLNHRSPAFLILRPPHLPPFRLYPPPSHLGLRLRRRHHRPPHPHRARGRSSRVQPCHHRQQRRLGRAHPQPGPLGPSQIQTRALLHWGPILRPDRLDGSHFFTFRCHPRHVPQRPSPFAAEYELLRGDQSVRLARRPRVLFCRREEMVHGP